MAWFPAFLFPKNAFRAPGQSRGRRPATCRPALETLETRVAPATSVFYDDSVGTVGLDPSNNLYVRGGIADTADLAGTGTVHQWLQGPTGFVAEYNSAGAPVWAKRLTDLFGADGNIGGAVTFTDPVSGQTSLYLSRSNSANSTFWISKLAADGTVLWNTQTGMAGDLAVDSAGAAYVQHSFNGTLDFDPQQPGQHVLTSNGQDAFLLKVDAAGNFQWVDQLGGAGTQWGGSVTVQNNTVYATGSFSYTFAPANFTDQGAVGVSQSADGYLAEYDTSGNYLTAYQFVDAQIGGVVVDGTGATYVAANFGRTADLNPDPNAQYLVDPANGGGAFVKLNADGTFAWAKQLGCGIGPIVLSGSSLYLGGNFSGTVDFDPGPGQYNLTAAGGQDAFTARYTTDGNFVWARQMGSSSTYAVSPQEGTNSLAVSSTALYAGGFFNPGPASFGSTTLTGSADYDGFLSRQDLSGNFQWAFSVASVVRTIDNGDAGYSEVGSGWKNNTSGGFEGDSRYHSKGSGAEKALWTFTNLPAGTYQVEATWVANSTNASNAPYTLNGGPAILVNQQVAPNDVLSDVYTTFWKILGTATVGSNGTLTVQLSDAANGRVVADGVRVILEAPASPQLSAPGIAPGGESAAAALTPAELAPIAQEAEERWAATGLTAQQRALLDRVRFSIQDLSAAGELGQTTLGTPLVLLDATADGWGWFVDSTPADDSEFAVPAGGGELQALPGSPALGHMDLLTVVEHELGHVLGLDDIDPGVAAHDLMTATLGTGTRRLPVAAADTKIIPAALAAPSADVRVVPFQISGGGTAPGGLPVFSGGKARHNATGEATHLGKYTGNEGMFELLSFDPATGTGTFRGSFVFVAADGDRLACNYGADPNNPGRFTLTPVGDGKVVAVFVAEFTPDPQHSTGRFAEVTGGSFLMVATSSPFVPLPNAQGYTPPFAYTWRGEGALEFSKGK
jgi:hypothetical protein